MITCPKIVVSYQHHSKHVLDGSTRLFSLSVCFRMISHAQFNFGSKYLEECSPNSLQNLES